MKPKDTLSFKDGIRNDLVFLYKGTLHFNLIMQDSASQKLSDIKNNVKNDARKDFVLKSGQFYDYFKAQEEEYSEYEIESIVAEADC